MWASILVIQPEEQNDCKGTGGNFGGDGDIPTMIAEVTTQFKHLSKLIKLWT